MPTIPDLDEEEFLELRTLLRHTIATDPFSAVAAHSDAAGERLPSFDI